jgi:CRISPR-associated protein Csd1
VVAFRAANDQFPFDKTGLREFWAAYLRQAYSEGEGECGLCGSVRPTVRIVPFQVYLMGQRCPFSAFNKDKTAFISFAKEQAANSPMCFDCVSKASQVLQHLLTSERHHRILTRDEAKGQGKSPLKNQMAVFWVRDPLPLEAEGGELSIDVESLLVEALGRDGLPAPPPDPEQVRALYGLPFSRYASAVHLDRNRFYLAILSPNKSRLVLREWIDESLNDVCRRLEKFDAARTIVTPVGSGEERVTIPEMIHSLRPWKVATAAPDANQARGIVRMAYAGALPPAGLLEKAVLRFRVPDRAETKKEGEELSRRRMALAATIKVALRFGRKEEGTLDTTRRSAARNCGELLAVLEEAQGRSSRWRVNATLVDRFYGSASTAPGTILALLVRRATQAHFPKIRKERLGYDELSKRLEDVMTAIDEAGGYPNTLTMREQGEFALGFYHQRAAFRSQRPGHTPGKEQSQ